MKDKKKCWYIQWVGDCVVCGRDRSYIEKRYGDEPTITEDFDIELPPGLCDDCEFLQDGDDCEFLQDDDLDSKGGLTV